MPDTSTSSVNSAGSRSAAYRFSLRGLLVFTLGIAAGLGIAKVSEHQEFLFDVQITLPWYAWDWFQAIRVTLATWLAVGLLEQARDLWVTAKGNPGIHRDLSTALRWAILWRCLAAIAAAGYVALQYASPFKLLPWEWEVEGMIAMREIPDAVLCMLLLTALGRTRNSRRNSNESRPIWSRCLTILSVLAALIGAGLLMDERMGIASLTHLAIRSLVPQVSAELHAAWIRGGFSAATLSVISFLLIWQLASRWDRPGRPAWIALVVLAIAAAGYQVLWAALWGMPRYSPAFFQTLHLWEPSFAIMSAVAIVACSSVVTGYVVSRTANAESTLGWRPANRHYPHEFAALAMLPFLLVVTQLVRAAEGPPLRWIATAAMAIAYDPVSLLWLAAFLDGSWRLVCWFRRRKIAWPNSVAAVPAGKLVWIGSATLVAVVLATASFAWLGFVIWLLVPIPWRQWWWARF